MEETREELTERKWKYQSNMNLPGTGKDLESLRCYHKTGDIWENGEWKWFLRNTSMNFSVISHWLFLSFPIPFLLFGCLSSSLIRKYVYLSFTFFYCLCTQCVQWVQGLVLVIPSVNKEPVPAALRSSWTMRPY